MQDNKLTQVLMTRHADVHNPKEIVYGRLPRFGLSQLGRSQSKEVADFLRDKGITQLYASPRLRARQTARVIGEKVGDPPMHISRLIDEVLTGHQGKSNTIHKDINFYEKPADPADETIAMIADRMYRFLQQIRRWHPGETVVAVSHADPIMILRTKVLGEPLRPENLKGKYYPTKCSITQFTFQSGSDTPEVEFLQPVKDITAEPEEAQPKHDLDGAA